MTQHVAADRNSFRAQHPIRSFHASLEGEMSQLTMRNWKAKGKPRTEKFLEGKKKTHNLGREKVAWIDRDMRQGRPRTYISSRLCQHSGSQPSLCPVCCMPFWSPLQVLGPPCKEGPAPRRTGQPKCASGSQHPGSNSVWVCSPDLTHEEGTGQEENKRL